MEHPSSLRKILFASAATLAALVVAVGLPIKKALAAPLRMKVKPAPTVSQHMTRLVIFQPKYVNPNAQTLVSIADRAQSDQALAERIWSNPDAVAADYHLSKNEAQVLRHMDRQQFETARQDATRLVADRLAKAHGARLPAGSDDARKITDGMIVGRAILAAVGRSYLKAADATGCCPWGHAIELGVSSDPATYDEVFNKPSEGIVVEVPDSAPMMNNMPAMQRPE